MSSTDKAPRCYSFLPMAWEERGGDVDAPTKWRFGIEGVGDAERKWVFATFEEMVLFLKEEIEKSSGE